MVFAVKLLAPEALASAVIGKGGAVIAQIRQSTQAKIALTEHSDLYPGTDCRVLTAQASTEESLGEATTQIVSKLADCAATHASVADQLGTPGELKLRALAPRAAVGGLIGKAGASIKQLRESSGAKITVSEAGMGPNSEQMISIVGSQQALDDVMVEINKHVSALSKETWFQSWATVPGTSSGSSMRGALAAPAPSYGPSYSGASLAAGPMVGHSAGVDMMLRVAQSLPPYVMQDSRGFALSCVVPNRLVGGLIGRGGAGTKEVQNVTQTKIGIRDIPGDPDNRSMNIAGPLASTCAAYMMMMKRYLDAEAAAP